MKRFWAWLKAHLTSISPEKAIQADVKGGAIGLKFTFDWSKWKF
jgi:hypothetical protein